MKILVFLLSICFCFCFSSANKINEIFVGNDAEDFQFIELKANSHEEHLKWHEHAIIVVDCYNSSIIMYIRLGANLVDLTLDRESNDCIFVPDIDVCLDKEKIDGSYPFYTIATTSQKNSGIWPAPKCDIRYPGPGHDGHMVFGDAHVYSIDKWYNGFDAHKLLLNDASKSFIIMLLHEEDYDRRFNMMVRLAPGGLDRITTLDQQLAEEHVNNRVQDVLIYGKSKNCPFFHASPISHPGTNDDNVIIPICGPTFNPSWSINRCSHTDGYAIHYAKYAQPSPNMQNDCSNPTTSFTSAYLEKCFMSNPCNNPNPLYCGGNLKNINELDKKQKVQQRNEANVILSRGDGIFPDSNIPLKKLYVCDRHKLLLISMRWPRLKSISKLKCNFPVVGGLNVDHTQRMVAAEKDKRITMADSKMLLDMKQIFVPLGTPICKAHKEYVKELRITERPDEESELSSERQEFSAESSRPQVTISEQDTTEHTTEKPEAEVCAEEDINKEDGGIEMQTSGESDKIESPKPSETYTTHFGRKSRTSSCYSHQYRGDSFESDQSNSEDESDRDEQDYDDSFGSDQIGSDQESDRDDGDETVQECKADKTSGSCEDEDELFKLIRNLYSLLGIPQIHRLRRDFRELSKNRLNLTRA